MDPFLIIAVLGFLLTLLVTLSSGVWAVAQIKSSTTSLRMTIESLTGSVDKLAGRIDEIEHTHSETRERLAAVEARQEFK